MQQMIFHFGIKRANINNIVSFVLLVVLSAAFILPLFWMTTTSLKPIDQLMLDPPVWIPDPLEFDNYPNALEAQPFLQYLGNSLQIAVAAVIGACISNSLVAYGFSRVEWKGRDVVFVLVLSTLMLPYHVVMIPLFVSFSKIGWVNTWLPLIVPAWLGHPFFIFMLRQFMLGIPKELSEATRIDGGSEWVLLTRVILPLCKPALALAVLLNQKVKGLSVFRTIFYLPSILPLVATSIVWTWLLHPQYGAVSVIMAELGLPVISWFSDPQWAKPALILMSMWGTGWMMLIYLAALQDVPQELYDVASLDGASLWAKFRNVTVPMISPIILFNTIVGLIGTFQYFTEAYIITEGGPGDSTLFYSLYLFQNAFAYFKMGYASAMAWLLFLVILILTFIIFRSSAKRVYYHGN